MQDMVSQGIRAPVSHTGYTPGVPVKAHIVQQYPHLRPADIHDALAYAYDHAAEIDADLASDDEVVIQQQWSGARR